MKIWGSTKKIRSVDCLHSNWKHHGLFQKTCNVQLGSKIQRKISERKKIQEGMIQWFEIRKSIVGIDNYFYVKAKNTNLKCEFVKDRVENST